MLIPHSPIVNETFDEYTDYGLDFIYNAILSGEEISVIIPDETMVSTAIYLTKNPYLKSNEKSFAFEGELTPIKASLFRYLHDNGYSVTTEKYAPINPIVFEEI